NPNPRPALRNPARPSSSSAKMSVPARRTVPCDGVSSPASRPSSVDFPEPEAPTMASVSPACTVKLMSCKIVSSPVASATFLVSPITAIAESASGAFAIGSSGATGAADITETTEDSRMQDFCKEWGGIAHRWLVHLRRNSLLMAFALLATNAYSASKTVLVLGDSLSAEYGLARGTGWVALLEQRLQAKNIDAVVVNASISGETTSGGKARLPALLDKYHPALVVIELGGNDGLRGLPLSASEANLRAMISTAQQAKA